MLTANGQWQTSNVVSSQAQSFLPAGLTNGTTAIALTTNSANASSGSGLLGSPNYGFDNMMYGGTRVNTRANLLTALGTPSNHLGNDATPFAFGVGPGFGFPTDFTVTDALPLSWGGFNGTLQQQAVKIQWETLQENNTLHFDIEYSEHNNTGFQVAGQVAAAGNSSAKRTYRFNFRTALPVIYIRIKQVDIDGQFTYSKIISLRDENAGSPFLLNNPVNDNRLLLFLPAAFKTATYSIVSINGSIIQSGKFNSINSGNYPIILPTMTRGSYRLMIFNDGKKINLPFIKQ